MIETTHSLNGRKNNALPRERAVIHGIEILSDQELVAILLRTGTKELNVIQLAANILISNNGLFGLSKLSLNELKRIKGLKEAKALSLLAAFELAKRLNDFDIGNIKFLNPNDVYSFFAPLTKNKEQECFYVGFLNTKNILTSYKKMFVGSLNKSIVHPRDIFREAVKNNAAKIVIVHNHPSGDPTPSNADIIITKELMLAGELVDVPIVDHIIIGGNTYISLREIGAI